MGTIQFDPMAFVESLKYMGVGMLCIIIVMAIIIGATMLLNAVFKADGSVFSKLFKK